MDLGLKSHMKGLDDSRGGGGWGGRGPGGNKGNFGMGVRASISKPTPFIYLAFEKNGPIHILDHPK